MKKKVNANFFDPDKGAQCLLCIGNGDIRPNTVKSTIQVSGIPELGTKDYKEL